MKKFYFLAILFWLGPWILAADAMIYDCSHLLFSGSQEQGPSPESLGYRGRQVQLLTDDGITLNSLIIHSSKQPPLGLVVQFHGQGGNSSEIWHKLDWLLAAGYDVFAAEYRGFNGSGGKPSLRGALEDVHTGLAFANGLASAGDLPLIAVGHSLGGHVLYKALSLRTYDRLKVILTEGMPFSIRQAAREMAPRLPQPQKALAYLSSWFLPAATELVPQELVQIKNILKVVVHAPEDQTVAATHGDLLFASLSEPKVFLKNSSADHAVGFSASIRPEILELLVHRGL